MRIHVVVGLALAAVLLAGPLAGVAQKFQEPTKEELRMTADPMAPGAPAVYLYREETTDNGSHFIGEYARIKVLTELGKEWATVEVPYAGDGAPPRIEGRTIHADGTVVPLTGKPEDLLVKKSYRNHLNARVFNLPSVEVGSILEYRWTLPMGEGHVGGVTNDMQGFMDSALASSIPYWNVQREIFIHKEHFYYNPLSSLEKNVLGNQSITHVNSDGEVASYLLYSARLPAGAHVEVSPRPDYTLDIENVPPVAHESHAPPEQALRYSVRFYYSPYLSADVYWTDESKRWAKAVDHAAEPGDALKAAAAQITAGAASDDEKARRLYEAVQALDNTAYSRARSEAERVQLGLSRTVRGAQQVWSEKSGTPNEMATVYLALARAAGLQASGMSVADRSQRIFDPGYLSLGQLTVDLVVLHINGQDVFLDPGEKLLPYGQLRWSHTLCGGLLETAGGVSHSVVTPPNQAKDAITAHTADLTVDAQGGVTGTVKILMNGPEALRWRQLNLTADTAEVKRQLGEVARGLLPRGIGGEVESLQGLDTSAGFLVVAVKVSGQLGNAEGKRLLLPGFFFSTGAHTQFVAEEKREAPVDLHYAEQVINDVVYHVPAGYAVESAPQPVQLLWPEHAALVVKTQPGPGTIDIKHIFARAFVLLPASEYPALRDYYQKIAVNDQQQLVLARGN
ncbi:MAG: DUF3857 domain-containing protein [Terracidiphilus sp.]